MDAEDKYDEVAKHAVGAALLFRVSRNGGSHGPSIDQRRADEAARQISGEELYALLLDAARRATERAQHEAETQRWRIVQEVRRLAEASDSLSLHRFIEKEVTD